MKYFEVLVLIIFFLGSLGWFYHFYRRISVDNLFKLLRRDIFKQQSKSGGSSFFSSQAVQRLARLAARKGKEAAEGLRSGESDVVRRWATALSKTDAAAWEEMLKPGKGRKKLEAAARKKPTANTLLMLGAIYAANGESSKIPLLLEKLEPQRLPPYLRGLKAYLTALPEIEEGNLQTAAEKSQAAIQLFKRAGARYEEALAYLSLGTIFRVAGAADTAQVMLEAAQKIFEDIGAARKEAEAWGNLGMLMVMQERFEEAAERFETAKVLYRQSGENRGEADILNQEALAGLIRKDFKTAKDIALKAASGHQACGNRGGEGLSREILSHTALAAKNWDTVIEEARQAQNLYRQTQNTAAEFEAMFLEAQGLFELEKDKEAELILRSLIKENQERRSCFHSANAFNLLGRIFMRKNDLKRARGFFQQSLDCELKDERLDGIAIDYANIALVELRRGQVEQARQTVSKAIEYAQACGDSQLAEELEKEFNKSRAELSAAGAEKRV